MRIGSFAVALFTVAPGWAASGDDCTRDCGGQPSCEVEVADCLLDAGRTRDAIASLKNLVDREPAETRYALRLARAYLADDNSFWAQRVLQRVLEARPDDCVTRSWLAWVHLKQGLIDEADEVLGRPGCPKTEAERGRWALLRAHAADAQEADARGPLEEADAASDLYAEDLELLEHLRRKSDPGWISPLDLRVESMVGYTSDARAGLPLDTATTEGPGPSSVLGGLDLNGRFVWPAPGRARPAVDVAFSGYGLADDDARKYSFAQVWVRPGVILGRALPRLLLAYKADLFYLPDYESVLDRGFYYQAHRAEIELEAKKFLLYGGVGRRLIDEDGRDRTEFDGGGGWSFVPSRWARLLLGATARYQLASDATYDLVGGTGLLVLMANGPRGFSGQATLSGGFDHYTSSFDAFVTGEKRRDILSGASAAVWGPRWGGARVGLLYDYARRESNAEAYDLQEHRAMLRIRWSVSVDPFAPRAHGPAGHVPLDYGLGDAGRSELAEERMRELLQQDEADRRNSCGCGG